MIAVLVCFVKWILCVKNRFDFVTIPGVIKVYSRMCVFITAARADETKGVGRYGFWA